MKFKANVPGPVHMSPREELQRKYNSSAPSYWLS